MTSFENKTSETTDEKTEKESSLRIFASMSAGAGAGAIAKTIVAPLDRTKIFFQTNPGKEYRLKKAVRYIHCSYRSDGFLSLWRGNSATLARVVPYAAIQFGSHEQYKKLLGIDVVSDRAGLKRSPYLHFVAGSLAGTTGQALTYPLDRARAIMAVTKIGQYRNIFQVFHQIVANEGIVALYRGFVPTIMGVIPYAGVSFFTFEMLKKICRQRAIDQNSSDTSPNPAQRLLFGATAGVLGQFSSYPLDVVRRRMQTAVQMGVSKNLYKTVIGTLLFILRNEGFVRGWYKGLSMNFIKGPLTVGTSYTAYDYLHILFQKMLSLEEIKL